ncbi:hypothetical protein [Humibacter ginsenosidimutans]|uniref:Uncharacterized protein n=1 Tax=Humibacter ginsenosidimutans TaxID=2599293 RepID=A0A5B8M5L8_9MICO|nr:hypothetical protein [Humibacter ginsenosidimutans]QDZ14770.1 hypothetical protein FPZ11_08365 [Humibacter ginsenosidimutans]
MSRTTAKHAPRADRPRVPHVHDFDPISGWCMTCNYRSDGRLTGPDGTVWRPGHDYTQAELNALRDAHLAGVEQ